MSGLIARRLMDCGIVLPEIPAVAGHYLPFIRVGDLVQVAGVAPAVDGLHAMIGKVGREVSLEDARRAARLCALNVIATLRVACGGDLDRVRRILMVRGFVNASEDFELIPSVVDGASELLTCVFGAVVGQHVRTSIGCAALPGRVPVELDALVLVEDGTRSGYPFIGLGDKQFMG